MVSLSRDGWQTFVCMLCPNSSSICFCANGFNSGSPAHANSFYLEWWRSKSRIESDVAKTFIVIWIAIGVWHGPLIGSLCVFIAKLPVQHIFLYPFLSFLAVHGWSPRKQEPFLETLKMFLRVPAVFSHHCMNLHSAFSRIPTSVVWFISKKFLSLWRHKLPKFFHCFGFGPA